MLETQDLINIKYMDVSVCSIQYANEIFWRGIIKCGKRQLYITDSIYFSSGDAEDSLRNDIIKIKNKTLEEIKAWSCEK